MTEKHSTERPRSTWEQWIKKAVTQKEGRTLKKIKKLWEDIQMETLGGHITHIKCKHLSKTHQMKPTVQLTMTIFSDGFNISLLCYYLLCCASTQINYFQQLFHVQYLRNYLQLSKKLRFKSISSSASINKLHIYIMDAMTQITRWWEQMPDTNAYYIYNTLWPI